MTAREHTGGAGDPKWRPCTEAAKWDGAPPTSPGESLIGLDSPSAL